MKVKSFAYMIARKHRMDDALKHLDQCVEKLGNIKIVDIDDTLYDLKGMNPSLVRRVVYEDK